jgi:hypothetical protein
MICLFSWWVIFTQVGIHIGRLFGPRGRWPCRGQVTLAGWLLGEVRMIPWREVSTQVLAII